MFRRCAPPVSADEIEEQSRCACCSGLFHVVLGPALFLLLALQYGALAIAVGSVILALQSMSFGFAVLGLKYTQIPPRFCMAVIRILKVSIQVSVLSLGVLMLVHYIYRSDTPVTQEIQWKW